MAGKKLFLLAGNGSNASWWEDAIPYFKKYHPIPVELPGSGRNTSNKYKSFKELAYALIDLTDEGSEIFAAGINSLVVLHALVLKPSHFSKVILLAPVGAFLWQRKFVKRMSRKLVRKIIYYLLCRSPKLFKKKFTKKNWSDAQFKKLSEGYKQNRAFDAYFEMTKPHNALELFEWIDTRIEIIWGSEDAVIEPEQLSAWDAILPRADLSLVLKQNWGHYPYMDDPQEFAEFIEGEKIGFRSHTKAGRLLLADLAGINIPVFAVVNSSTSLEDVIKKLPDNKIYAVRSSHFSEDKADSSNAGMFKTYLKVNKGNVSEKVNELLTAGIHEVIIQEFIKPEVSGVAFVRNITTEVEWIHGHLEDLVNGKVKPFRATLSKMSGTWQQNWNLYVEDTPFVLMLTELYRFLHKVIKTFHYQHSDIEWAWDKNNFYLLQIRPVTAYNWRRLITSANIDEILPKQVSKIMEHAQRRAALSISRIYSLFDGDVLKDNEPFTAVFDDASYINSDLFLSRFDDWGLPGEMYYREIGGSAPPVKFKPFRFVKNIPKFVKMVITFRKEIIKCSARFKEFEEEFDIIDNEDITRQAKEERMVNWFVRFYVFIVQTNIIIKALISSGGGSFLGKPHTVYKDVNSVDYPHRVKYESDPASPRNSSNEKPLSDLPGWSAFIRSWHLAGLPGMKGKYIEIREWFRDNNMRLFHRFHNRMKDSEWFDPYPGIRHRSGTFWQDGEDTLSSGFSFIIYPGKAEGVVGRDILIVESLEPGHLEEYKKYKAVISKTGGRLSHGAILLREIKQPSAVISDIDLMLAGKEIIYDNGSIRIKDPTT